MEVLKALVVFILVIGTFAEDTKRQGRCGSKPVNRDRYNQAKRKYQGRKPMPLHNSGGHKFNTNNEYEASGTAYETSGTPYDTSGTSYETSGTPYDTSSGTSYETQNLDDDAAGTPYLTSFDISPRISISPNGEIYRGRSLKHNGVRNFHEDDTHEHADHRHHELNDEDHDQLHKIRTVRAAAPSSSTSSGLGAQSLNSVSNGNSASAGDYLQATASGSLVEVQSHGSSITSGEGATYASGTTNISSQGRTKTTTASSQETPEALAATLAAQGAYLQSGGSSNAFGQGSATASGSTTNTATSSSTFSKKTLRADKK